MYPRLNAEIQNGRITSNKHKKLKDDYYQQSNSRKHRPQNTEKLQMGIGIWNINTLTGK